MLKRITRFIPASVLALAMLSAQAALADTSGTAVSQQNGVVKVKSKYSMDETITRLKQNIAGKGIMFFTQVDQSGLASNAGISLRPSALLIFGNPPLGAQFLTANPLSGLDWPVRLLVFQDESGQVWTAYHDFAHIARRHGITNRAEQFGTASKVIASITSSVTEK